jgi:hypothetical protein
MCNFCNNSGARLETEYDKSNKETHNFELIIYGNCYLRINPTIAENMPTFRGITGLRPESVKINFCPMCGRKL